MLCERGFHTPLESSFLMSIQRVHSKNWPGSREGCRGGAGENKQEVAASLYSPDHNKWLAYPEGSLGLTHVHYSYSGLKVSLCYVCYLYRYCIIIITSH